MLKLFLRIVFLLATLTPVGILAAGPAPAGRFMVPQAKENMLQVEKAVPGRELLKISPAQIETLQRLSTGSLNFSCNGTLCICKGDTDCNDMFTTNVCGIHAICVGSYCYCARN